MKLFNSDHNYKFQMYLFILVTKGIYRRKGFFFIMNVDSSRKYNYIFQTNYKLQKEHIDEKVYF